jgi:hypothetical protein
MRRSDHPYRNAFKCYLWRDGVPCLCPAWLSVTQQSDSTTGEQTKQVSGCAFQMLPWMLSGPIVKSSQVLGEVGGLRSDVQGVTQAVERGVERGLVQIGAAIADRLSQLVAAPIGDRGLLRGGDVGNANDGSDALEPVGAPSQEHAPTVVG